MSHTVPALPKFGVSEFTTWPWSFERDVQEYADLGLQAMEVCEFKLDPQRARQQLEDLLQRGLQIASVQPRLHSLFPDQPRPEPRDASARMALLRQSIDLFAAVAPGTTLVTIPGAAPEGNYRLAFETALYQYKALADYAGERGVRLALEPLNPILMNVDTFLCSLPDAMEVVNAVDSPNFGVFVDVWHIWQEQNAARHIEACGSSIFGVHINDWHRPRHFGDRISLGEGCIPLPGLLRALHASGYRGVYTLEIFSSDHLEDSLWRGDLRALIQQNRNAFGALWQQAFA